ncbi:flagellar protein FlaG [Pseudomonas sp. TUM22785]|uniref:flagellar protein FlaG n=1 Tax=Pseudomonas sp. TUM22785 TaxID=3019098 RepID=UPI0023051DBB|nr:flagellar protein FlaG [Pseudomonas sp. TUM22785]WCD82584.1 flagellar protein FlaG [Pseudomonas sp. TUM22785]
MDISNITSVGALPRLAKDPVASVTPGQEAARKAAPASPAVSSADADAQSQAQGGNLESAVADIQSFVQTVKRGLDFNVDDSSGEVVVKVIDTDSGKLIRQIPSEELLKLAERLEDIRSLMFEAKA